MLKEELAFAVSLQKTENLSQVEEGRHRKINDNNCDNKNNNLNNSNTNNYMMMMIMIIIV